MSSLLDFALAGFWSFMMIWCCFAVGVDNRECVALLLYCVDGDELVVSLDGWV